MKSERSCAALNSRSLYHLSHEKRITTRLNIRMLKLSFYDRKYHNFQMDQIRGLDRTCCFYTELDIWSLHLYFLGFGRVPSVFLLSDPVAFSFPPLLHFRKMRNLFIRWYVSHSFMVSSMLKLYYYVQRITGRTWWRISWIHQMFQTHDRNRK